MLLIFSSSLSTLVNTDAPRILSAVAGLPRCIGVPSLTDARAWGCPIIEVVNKDGTKTEESCAACGVKPAALALACIGQGMTNTTGRDGTPVTFSLPVDMSTVKAEYFQWTLSDGRTNVAECATTNGRPAGEPNELQTIAIIGDAGGWSTATITKMSIIGPLMLVQPNGTKVSAQGLEYVGPSLSWSNGCVLLDARLEVFSTTGETLKGKLFPPTTGEFPNHCRVNFPTTTHRIRMLWNGGVSHDGRRSVNPDEINLFRVNDATGAELPAASILGLADLGDQPAGTTVAARDGYISDSDNYLDLCLHLGGEGTDVAKLPASVDVLCGNNNTQQISMPKGLKKATNGLAPLSDPLCKPHTVSVHA